MNRRQFNKSVVAGVLGVLCGKLPAAPNTLKLHSVKGSFEIPMGGGFGGFGGVTVPNDLPKPTEFDTIVVGRGFKVKHNYHVGCNSLKRA